MDTPGADATSLYVPQDAVAVGKEETKAAGQVAVSGGAPSTLSDMIYLWLCQLRTMLWLHGLQRSRRKFHTLIEVISPSVVFLVLLYGVMGTPKIPVSSFVQTRIPVLNEYGNPYTLTPASLDLASVIAQESLAITDITADRAYFDRVVVPQLIGTASTLANQLTDTITSNTDAALPLVIPQLDQFVAGISQTAQAIGRAGEKTLEFISADVWFALNMGKLAFAPDTPDVRQLMLYLSVTTSSFSTITMPIPYVTAQAALDANPTPGALLAVIEFTTIDAARGQLDYVIHMNQTFVPKTDVVVDPFPQGLGADFAKYLHSGFATLEYEINEYFTRLTAAYNGDTADTAQSGVDALVSICNLVVQQATGNASLTLFPRNNAANTFLNGHLAAQPATASVVTSTLGLPAVLTPCGFEINAYCWSQISSGSDAVYACLRSSRSVTLVCQALLDAVSSTGPCYADILNNGFMGADAIGTNASAFPAGSIMLNSTLWSPSCRGSQWAAYVNTSATMSNPCATDLQLHCSGAKTDEERLSCLSQWSASLAPLCAAVVAALHPTNLCMDDFATVCPYKGLTQDFPLGCLVVHASVLSFSCWTSAIFTQASVLTAQVATVVQVPPAVSLCVSANGLSKTFHRGIGVTAFPAPGYDQSQFYKTTGTLFGLVAAMAYIFQFTSLVRFIVQDRELKHKTLLLAVGVPRSVIFIANFLVGTVSCVLSSFFAMFTLYSIMPGVALNITYGLLFLYSWSLSCMALILSRFCNVTRTASTVAPLVIFGTAIPAFVVVGKESFWDIVFSPSVIVSAFNEVALVSQSSEPLENITGSLLSAQLVLMAQAFVYLLIAWLMESVAASVRHGIVAHALHRVWACRDRFAGGSSTAHDDKGKDPASPLARQVRRSAQKDEELHSIPRQSQRSLAADLDDDSSGNLKGSNLTGSFRTVAIEFVDVCLNSWPGTLLPRLASVSFTIPFGRLTYLIGPTGSGKSSVLDLLFDVVEAASGTITLFDEGLYAFHHLNMGACLQRNVVWEALTVREHVDMLHSLKGDVYESDVHRQKTITQELDDLDLLECQHHRASKITHGTARRMAVAMAFAGDKTTAVLLDSPTDGVDPRGAELIHAFIDARKATRCVVVATSHFAEAEDADHVIVLDRGAVVKSGSPAEVRGSMTYCATFVTDGTLDVKDFAKAISRKLPSSLLLDASSHSGLDVLRFGVSAEDEDGDHMAQALKQLRDEYRSITNIGVSSLGLEHALTSYLRVRWESQAHDALAAARAHRVKRADDIVEATVGEMGASLLENAAMSLDLASSPGTSAVISPVKKKEGKNAARQAALRDGRIAEEHATGEGVHFEAAEGTSVGTDEERANRQSGVKRHCRMVITIIAKRIAGALSESTNFWLQFFLPLLCVALALLLLSIPDPAPVELSLDAVSLFGSGQEVLYATYGMDDGDVHGPGLFNSNDGGGVTYIFQGNGSSVDVGGVLDEERFEHPKVRYGAFVWMNPMAFVVNQSGAPKNAPDATFVEPVPYTWMADTVMHNTSSSHALPSFVALLQTSRILSRARGTTTAKITVTSHPFAAGVAAITTEKIVRNLVSVMLLLVPFSFFPANYIASVVRERESGFLDVMLASGLSKTHYWLGTFIWNMMGFTLFSFAALFIFVFFGNTGIFVGSADATTTFFLMFMYGACATVLAYAASFLFKKPNTAQNAVMMTSLLTGFVLVSAWSAMDLVADSPATHDARERNKQLGEFLRLFPSFALGQGLVKLSMAPILRFVEQTTASDQAAPSMQLMGLFPVYLFFIIIGEKLARSRSVRLACRDKADMPVAPPAGEKRAWQFINTVKEFPSSGFPAFEPIAALDEFNVTIQPNRCTAIIGGNSSGKSTLAAIAAGSMLPTSGTVVSGFNQDPYFDDMELRMNLGVSIDDGFGLEDCLTPYVLLHLMADLRGLRVSDQRALHVIHVLRDTGIYYVRNKKLKYLGEPTRRRVAVAMAMVGYPERVILDGAVTGLDPAARRSVFRSIKAMQGNCTVLLTAHSVAELGPFYHGDLVFIEKGAVTSVKSAAGDSQVPTILVVTVQHRKPIDRVAVTQTVVQTLIAKIRESEDVTASLPKGPPSSTSFKILIKTAIGTPAEEVLEAVHAVRRLVVQRGTDVVFSFAPHRFQEALAL